MYEIFKSQFDNLPEITGLPFRMKGYRWISATYINGDSHSQHDKTYAVLRNKGVYIKEQGGDDVSLPEWLELYGDKTNLGNIPSSSSVFIPQVERIFVDPIHWESTIPLFYSGNLFKFLDPIFGADKVRDVFHKYNAGENGDEMIFWRMTESGNVCFDSRISYGVDGRRDKARGGYRKHKVDDGYSAKCAFGQHLVSIDSEVCVVESEKAALIMALVENKGRIWVGLGGDQHIGLAKEGWKLYGDNDKAGRAWNGEKWWQGFDVKDGWGPDDLVLDIFKNKSKR